jgi:RNA polymerase sigma-70 factor (ECF subfamily)
MTVTELKEQSDETLARLAQKDPASETSRQAASTLFGRYMSRVYIWCLRYVREHEQALDLAQDVLLSAYRNLESYEGRAKFFSWLFVIARNRCLNAVRRPSLLHDVSVEPEDLAGSQPGPDREFEEKLDEESFLNLARERLDSQEQEAIHLRCFERMPVDEISVVLNIREASGARGVLQRARRKLRAALAERRVPGDSGLPGRMEGAEP